MSLSTVQMIFRHHGLEVFDVEELTTHGGSLRVFAQHPSGAQVLGDTVAKVLDDERVAGLNSLRGYDDFSGRVSKVRDNLLAFLDTAKNENKTVVGYGAPAKGNTLLNFCGIGPDAIQYTVDRSPHKQDRLLPGTHIPVHAPERIVETKPDYVLILPWNLQDEIVQQLHHIEELGREVCCPHTGAPDTRMKFIPTNIEGAYLLEWETLDDDRGYFARTRSNKEYSELGLNNDLSECSVSFNNRRGTLRGMHYQAPPHEETKLVMCVSGLIFDALVDLRPGSKTYLATCSAELSLANRRMLYVPAGVAHGFMTLEDNSYVYYQIGGDYMPDAARGVRWDDPAFSIEWPMQPIVLADRDRNYGDYKK